MSSNSTGSRKEGERGRTLATHQFESELFGFD